MLAILRFLLLGSFVLAAEPASFPAGSAQQDCHGCLGAAGSDQSFSDSQGTVSIATVAQDGMCVGAYVGEGCLPVPCEPIVFRSWRAAPNARVDLCERLQNPFIPWLCENPPRLGTGQLEMVFDYPSLECHGLKREYKVSIPSIPMSASSWVQCGLCLPDDV